MAAEVQPTARISVRGPLRITVDGRDATPRGRKAQGLVALLALSPGLRRPRRWLEDKLWSDRGPEQAGASLRQALTELRRDLGDLVLGDRIEVALDLARVAVEQPGLAGPPLFEGLDVPDPVFEEWLRLERARHDPEAAPERVRASPLRLRAEVVEDGSPQAGLLGVIMSDQVTRLVNEQIGGWTQAGPAAEPADLLVESRIVAAGSGCVLMVRAVDQLTRRVLHSGIVRVPEPAAELLRSDALAKASFEIAEKVMAQLPLAYGDRAEVRAAALARKALDRMFTFERGALGEAEALLSTAFEADGRGSHLAWRGLVRTFGLVERFSDDAQGLGQESEALARQALELAEGNSLTLAILSQMHAVQFGDARTAGEFAQRAVDLNPGNAFAWQALGIARMMLGDSAEALRLSRIGRGVATGSRYRHWWDIFHAIIAASAGQYGEALAAAEESALGAPQFRPAYRHLIALHAERGDLEAAQKAITRLQALEPDFTVDRMVDDPRYPVRSLRRTPLLKLTGRLLK